MSDYKIDDYNRGGMIAFMFSMVVTTLFFVYIAFVHPGVDLKEIQAPEKKEAPVANPNPEPASN
ncbi:MAG: hypothetical protein K2Q26_09705 [Bdellovibrionales bacterium]|nr:hypothetical protein [Bdellovibrionales bacterium]